MRDPFDDDPAGLNIDELSRALALPSGWLIERVSAGLIEAQGQACAAWRFDARAVRRVRSMRRIEHGFGAEPELAALVADLEEQIASLRARLARFER